MESRVTVKSQWSRFSTGWSDRNQLTWLGQKGVDIGYLGWVNRGNLGDESMCDLQGTYAGALSFRTLPLDRLTRRVVLARRPTIGTVLLGGGTLIGRDGWADKVRDAQARARVGRVAVLGAGVENPAFGQARGITTSEGVRRWIDILQDAAVVGVRGPRSQQDLERWGVESHIIGDPALVLPIDIGRGNTSDLGLSSVSVNLAAVADGYAMGATDHYGKLMSSLERLASTGATIRFFAMEPRDAAMMREIVPRRLKYALRSMPTCLTSLYELLQASSVVISERLHGSIIAANLGRPSILMGYKPKCYDFAESIGVEETVVELGSVGSQEFDALVARQLNSKGLPGGVVERIDQLRRKFHLVHQGLFQ